MYKVVKQKIQKNLSSRYFVPIVNRSDKLVIVFKIDVYVNDRYEEIASKQIIINAVVFSQYRNFL